LLTKARASMINAWSIHLGTLGACRNGGRRPDIGYHDLGLRAQARAGQRAHDKSLREDFYRDFIVAASAYGNAVVSNEPQIQELVALYAMISRMRILTFPVVPDSSMRREPPSPLHFAQCADENHRTSRLLGRRSTRRLDTDG
jgi:hypothetical protein